MHWYAIWLILAYIVHISVVPERDKRSQSSSKPWFRRAQKPGINRASLNTIRSALQLHDASAAARCIIVTFMTYFQPCKTLLGSKSKFSLQPSEFATLPHYLLPVAVTPHLILLQNVGSNAVESTGAGNK